jgi:glycosyltransferase involved in cell wall biosynthesis
MLIGIDASRATVARRTGTEFYSLRLIEALLALDTARLSLRPELRPRGSPKSGHRFRLYFNRPPEKPGFFKRNQVPELRTIPFPRLWTHVRLGLEVAIRPPDVLFVPSHVLPLWTRPPGVVTVHDLGYLYFPEAHPPRQRWYLGWSTRHNARTARVVVADSEATKRDLVTHYGVRPDKIVVAYPGFDPDLVPVADPAAIATVKRRYGIHPGEPPAPRRGCGAGGDASRGAYFIHIGTLQPRKNLARLIQAFAALQPKVQLVLAGKRGWLYDDLFRQVSRLGLEDRVVFPGYVDDDDKAALLSGALAYVFPSLYEGFGFPALEAQACDTPLICANSSSLPEVAGDAALLIDPTDVDDLTQAMASLLTDAVLRADLVARGRRNRERFSWRACAEKVMEALEAAARADE